MKYSTSVLPLPMIIRQEYTLLITNLKVLFGWLLENPYPSRITKTHLTSLAHASLKQLVFGSATLVLALVRPLSLSNISGALNMRL